MKKKRHPLVAFLLALFGVGLGQVYNGELSKAICLIFIMICWLCLFMTPVAHHHYLGPVLFEVGIFAFIGIALEAAISADRIKEIELRWYNRWYIYVVIMLLIYSIKEVLAIKENYLEAFEIPAISMESTLTVGDDIMVDKSFFKTHEPTRGDIVVILLPDDPMTPNEDESETKIIKRIVAIGGDTVEVRKTELIINDQKIEEPYVKYLKGGTKDFAATVVPKDQVFLLGDNRDSSRDSRFWTDPFIDRSRIIGKPLYIYWPPQRLGMEINKR